MKKYSKTSESISNSNSSFYSYTIVNRLCFFKLERLVRERITFKLIITRYNKSDIKLKFNFAYIYKAKSKECFKWGSAHRNLWQKLSPTANWSLKKILIMVFKQGGVVSIQRLYKNNLRINNLIRLTRLSSSLKSY